MNVSTPNNPDDQASMLAADDALDALLRADAATWRDSYLNNDGFSERVMQRVAALPAPVRGTLSSVGANKRIVIVSIAAALASSVVVFSGAGGNFLIDAVMDIATFTVTPAVLAVVGMTIVAAAVAVGTVTNER